MSPAKQQAEKGVFWESSERAKAKEGEWTSSKNESPGQQIPIPRAAWHFLEHPRRKMAVCLGSLAMQAAIALDRGLCFFPQSPRMQELFASQDPFMILLSFSGSPKSVLSPLCLLSPSVSFYVSGSLMVQMEGTRALSCPRV